MVWNRNLEMRCGCLYENAEDSYCHSLTDVRQASMAFSNQRIKARCFYYQCLCQATSIYLPGLTQQQYISFNQHWWQSSDLKISLIFWGKFWYRYTKCQLVVQELRNIYYLLFIILDYLKTIILVASIICTMCPRNVGSHRIILIFE